MSMALTCHAFWLYHEIPDIITSIQCHSTRMSCTYSIVWLNNSVSNFGRGKITPKILKRNASFCKQTRVLTEEILIFKVSLFFTEPPSGSQPYLIFECQNDITMHGALRIPLATHMPLMHPIWENTMFLCHF